MVVAQFDLSSRASVLCAARDLSEPAQRRRVLCDAIIARLARFHIKLSHYR